ncbi:hypothetical protein TWF730_003296 [Orbilia blumenaviensis]|uniref:Uncharacterized protein n=1 Tax=Orbilia blumenaviensis TaxID=1796055 RepID=A0AAV9U554_9PEZI
MGPGPGDMSDAPLTFASGADYSYEDAPDTYDRHTGRPIKPTSGLIPMRVSTAIHMGGSTANPIELSRGIIPQPTGPRYAKYAKTKPTVIVNRAEWVYFRCRKVTDDNGYTTFSYTFNWKAGVRYEDVLSVDLLECDVKEHLKPPLKYNLNYIFQDRGTGGIWGVDRWHFEMITGKIQWEYKLSSRDSIGRILEPVEYIWRGESELSRTSEWTRLRLV